MKRTVVMIGVVVLMLSLVAIAADQRALKVTAQPVPGGKAYQPEVNATAPIFSNLAVKDPKGLYFCCSGWELTGPDWLYSQYGYQWIGLQFVLAKQTTVHKISTSVTYFEAGSFTDFLLSIQADANGIPSGTPLGTGPWAVTLDSQSFGQCCTLEVEKKIGLKLAAGTYWVVWSTESNSDLYAGINDEVLDGVDGQTIAYFYSTNNVWYAYQSTSGPAVEIQ